LIAQIIDNKVRRLTSLSPDYASLLRQRDTLDERLKNYNAKEQEALVNQQQAEATNENVKVIAWPKFPNKGVNTRWRYVCLGFDAIYVGVAACLS